MPHSALSPKAMLMASRASCTAPSTGQAPGKAVVEGAGEFDCGPVADGKLHGDHRRDAAASQYRARAGKDAVLAGPGALAGVDDGQAQARVVGKEPAQLGGRQKLAVPACLVDQGHTSFASFAQAWIEVAVADEVEDVPVTGLHRPVQIPPRLALHPDQLDLARLDQVVDGLDHPSAFLLCVQRRQILWAGDHPQDPDGRLKGQGLDRPSHFEIADQRCLTQQGDVITLCLVVEEFPGQRGQLRGLQPQAQTQELALFPGRGQAAAVPAAHFGGKQRFEQDSPHPLCGLEFALSHGQAIRVFVCEAQIARSSTRAAQSLQRLQRLLKHRIVKLKLERCARLTRG